MFNPIDWLHSGRDAAINGLLLRPRAHPNLKTFVLSATMGQATVYLLEGNGDREWMLKKFHPGRSPDTAYVTAIRSLVPRVAGFEAGWERQCLTGSMVAAAGYTSSEFVEWIDGTILMPRVQASSWADYLGEQRDGIADPDTSTRAAVAEGLCHAAQAIEEARVAHRDLSATNVMIDAGRAIHLIDWDSLFAPSLRMPANTTIGTNGYVPPFVREAGDDPASTWMAGADRFALAVLVLETFAAQTGCAFCGDGGLLDQDQINARAGATLQAALSAAGARAKEIPQLFARALAAQAPKDCPTPRAWLRALSRSRPRPSRARAVLPSAFVTLDRNAFVKLELSRFSRLSA